MLSDHLAAEVLNLMPYTATADQEALIYSLTDYMVNNRASDIFILNGYAGTGKSTVIAAFTAMLKQNNVVSHILAPTGRAAKVVSAYSGGVALTIHKKIYRQKSISEPFFVQDYNKDKGSFFIVDEASMIGVSSVSDGASFGTGDLLSDLVSYVRSGTDCRLILVGDTAQLPPVGTSLSPALSVDYMEGYAPTVTFTMRDIIRQAHDSGILMNATVCREIIESQRVDIPRFSTLYPDTARITGADVLEEIETAYSLYSREKCVVITRSNKQAGRFNRGIRERILYQEEELSSGDLVMIVKNNYSYKLDNNPDNDTSTQPTETDKGDFIANGDVALIRRVRRYEEIHGCRFADVTLWLGSDEERELDCKVLLDTLMSDAPSLPRDKSQSLLASVEADYAHFTRKRDRYKAMRQDPYLNALHIKFAYAITCHKSQGGEWDAVFIDRVLFGDEAISPDLLRWLYTALTRATKKVFFVNYDDRFFLEGRD